MKAFHKRRLRKVADYMEAKMEELKGRRWFGLDNWAEEGWGEHKCGTAACVLGWATEALPSKLRMDCNMVPRTANGPAFGLGAGMVVFGIHNDVASWLFMPNGYPESRRTGQAGAREAIRRLRLLADVGEEAFIAQMERDAARRANRRLSLDA